MTIPLNSEIDSGLTEKIAAERLAAEGFNELPSAKPRNVFAIVFNVVREPMFLLLIACGGIYLLLGNRQEALMLLGFVIIVIGITFIQEHKSERALEALRDLSSPRALVIRDRKQRRIAGREVVRGDIVMLSEGDRVPADAVLLSSLNLSADESLLTGESVAVRKLATDGASIGIGRPGGDDLPFVFSGTLVTQGKGSARVVAIGADTALGRIGKTLFAAQEEPTRLQREMARVVKLVAAFAMILAAMLAVWYGATRADWLNGFLVGLTLAMAILPEEIPVVLALFLALGAWRISRKQVLTRRIPAIEMLGAATVLCVDKTGTLTQNRMALAQLFADGKLFEFDQAGLANTPPLPEEFHEVLEFGMLASHRDPFDPTEQAIQQGGRAALASTEHLHDNWNLIDEYPLSKALLAMSRVWQSPDREHYVIAAKGAPEAIADLCHLDQAQVEALTRRVNQMAGQGLRVLGVANAAFRQHSLPEIQHDFEFRFLGLIGLVDPLRPTVGAALQESYKAGIRVIMITGDYPATAQNIARQSGLVSSGGIITGIELDAMDDAQLRRRIADVNIFCRVAPEQKLRLVNVLKAAGEIVAMTGDGVNDAPALKTAHIGVAMGGRGSDVARESADLVLLDDDFSSIVAAVKLGRRIFDNLRKVLVFIIGAHVPIAGMAIVPVMMGWPIMLMPVHVLFLQLIIDPTCSIVFEAESEEADVMLRPPRSSSAAIFDRQVLLSGLLQGALLFGAVLGILAIARYRGLDAGEARALAFTAMVIGNVGLIFANRSWSRSARAAIALPNPALWWVAIGAVSLLAVVLLVPALRELFYFGTPRPEHVILSGLAVLTGLGLIGAVQAFGWLRIDRVA